MTPAVLHIDPALFQRFTEGDEQAFKALYDGLYRPVLKFARSYVADLTVVEDIATETFIKCWQKRAHFEHIGALRSFIFVCAKNGCLNYLRQARREDARYMELQKTLELAEEINFAEPAVTEQVLAYLYGEMARLAPKTRTVLELHLQGLDNGTIARKMDLAEKTVRNLKSEALKTLRLAALDKQFFVIYTLLLNLLFSADW